MTDAGELATQYMPDGVAVDDTNRHAAGQLAIAWLALAPEHRRLVVEYERALNPGKAAAAADLRNSAGVVITHGEAADLLATPSLRRVLHLRSLMREETIPPAMIGRILSRIALGLEDATPHAKIRACTELARVQGAYVPPSGVKENLEGDRGAEGLDQEAKDRIMAGASWLNGFGSAGVSFADLLRARAAQADADEKAAQDALADASSAESVRREVEAAKPPARRKKYRRTAQNGVSAVLVKPVIGTVPEHLANTDALHVARAKMRGGGNG